MASRAPARENDPTRRVDLHRPLHPSAKIAFLAVLLAGLAFAGTNVVLDTVHAGQTLAIGAFSFLTLALIIALAFEFVNGFHDTANAVATVIYTHSMPPITAVIWSGVWNFIGVVISTGAVAYSIITLLPVELILNVGSAGGFAMIFALLLAAVVWNLGTWWLGLPNSSSHALIGSILGVGLANQFLSTAAGGTSGVDWKQAESVLLALLVSPLIGFIGALVLLWTMKRFLRDPVLYREPAGDTPPPWHVRSLLVFTCTAVSFAHGSNDGQKGMGLIMLILIGVAPTAYALNRTMPDSSTAAFVSTAHVAGTVLHAHGGGAAPLRPERASATLSEALRTQKADRPEVFQALELVSGDISRQLENYGSIRQVPAAATRNLRNEMYLVYDTLRLLTEDREKAGVDLSEGDVAKLLAYQHLLEKGTRYIPTWVKISVALALGLGTMVGWKRIVVTVGERIGKTHLTYGMGAAAELVAASTILLAQVKGLPVSTTHILSSGVAGAMVGDGAGLQMATVRNIALAWVMTLPAAMLLAGLLYATLLAAVRAFGLG
ncbi:inorganic phosphate transporter [Sphingomonas sp. BIUV-7]|uniref:Phosphate transporter n=1 Tax=Sphingomonas natans TaxID=3063330 RepID=A0ABT8Y9G5_9SPHN|nr:inorganic phosphate transporter [Sphingomonas sp. BIUV-7]MDO6414979.1 inorganic phosphate transporter [Sphingomonas sp. BIUV-7]